MTLANRLGRVTARTITVVVVGALLLLGLSISRPPAAHAAGIASAEASIENLIIHRVGTLLLQERIEHDVLLHVEGFAPNRQLLVVGTSTTLIGGMIPEGLGEVIATLVTDNQGKADYYYEISYPGLVSQAPGTQNTVVVDVACTDVGEATVANDTVSVTAYST